MWTLPIGEAPQFAGGSTSVVCACLSRRDQHDGKDELMGETWSAYGRKGWIKSY